MAVHFPQGLMQYGHEHLISISPLHCNIIQTVATE